MRRPKGAAAVLLPALFLAAALAAASPSRAQSTAPAVAFIETMSQRAISGLTDPSRDEAEREAVFRRLLNEAFNIPAIGRFVIGRRWRQAGREQRTAFLDVFEDVVVQRFLPLFAQYSNERLTLGKARRDGNDPRHIFVDATFNYADGTPVKLVWRLFEKDSQLKIIDVFIEGVSMALSLRSEYGSVMKSSRGLEGLVKILRDKVERGAYAVEFTASVP